MEAIQKGKNLPSPLMQVDSDGEDEDDKFSKASFASTSFDHRQNHSEIEKRRRDKMNSYITELSTMVPMCSAMNRKLDKLTVLRMAVQHMKTLRGSNDAHTEVSHKPSFLSDDELKHLILKAADGFLFVVGCDRGRMLYVSKSVRNILCFSQAELIGQSLFDFLHPKDISKVKEQLSSDLTPRERLIDAKTMLPVKTEMPQRQSQLCSGARRSFFCRMKSGMKSDSNLKHEKELELEPCHKKKKSDRKNYSVIHCTGYLKSWPPAKMGIEDDNEGDSDSCNLSCLVAVGKLQPVSGTPFYTEGNPNINIRPVEFVSRHAIDGKFTYVDQRATAILGYLPQELLGTSVYEYYHYEDLSHLSDTHRKALRSNEKVETGPYLFKVKDGSFIQVKTKLFSFKSPWTKEVEYLVCTNTVLPTQEVSSSSQSIAPEVSIMQIDEESNEDRGDDFTVSSTSVRQKSGLCVPGVPGGTRAGAGRIGRQIVEEFLEIQKEGAPQETSHKKSAFHKVSAAQGSSSEAAALPINPAASSNVIQHSGPANGLSVQFQNHIGMDTPLPSFVDQAQDVVSEVSEGGSGSDGNDEAAMAVIMSLLEADAGLGGPVDFSDLPWPL